ncbi:MAG TPA: acyl-CoA thioesterase domain-containing protein [Polyangiales bacterium]|nr:acyl-CoA thioesterase domain-containing protein [Polyangiales bacterium]
MNLPQAGVEWLLELLDLQHVGQGVYTGSPSPDGNARTRMFGGQLIAQALAAASFTTPDELQCQSLHAYFVRPAQAARTTDFEVANMRDGRSSALRKVMAVQRDELVCELTASFAHTPSTESQDFQIAMPAGTAPDELFQHVQNSPDLDAPELRRRPLGQYGPLQLMPAKPRPAAPRMYTWIRFNGALPSDPKLHACALAYASDLGAVHASMEAIGVELFDAHWQVASLDHAVWFHRPFRADEWLLFAFDCTTVAAERGLNHGLVYSQKGELVASITQEALLRRRDPLLT